MTVQITDITGKEWVFKNSTIRLLAGAIIVSPQNNIHDVYTFMSQNVIFYKSFPDELENRKAFIKPKGENDYV